MVCSFYGVFKEMINFVYVLRNKGSLHYKRYIKQNHWYHVIWQIFMFSSFFFQPRLPSFVYLSKINPSIFFTLTSIYHFIIFCIWYSCIHYSTILVTFFCLEKSFRLTFDTYITMLAPETYMLHNTYTLIFI